MKNMSIQFPTLTYLANQKASPYMPIDRVHMVQDLRCFHLDLGETVSKSNLLNQYHDIPFNNRQDQQSHANMTFDTLPVSEMVNTNCKCQFYYCHHIQKPDQKQHSNMHLTQYILFKKQQ